MILRLFLVICLSGCSGPAYYAQAISGHKKLMQSRQDIQVLLSDPATPDELAAQLETAEQIKAFAQSELGLPVEDSYSTYVKVEGEAPVWNVVATREFSLEPKKWCFPVAGCVPYRGYFKPEDAQESASRLASKGLDVIVSPVAAYSSLGWFNDPLLSTMISGSGTRLAAYLFHELAHQRLYLKNDGMFNEGYASFIEDTGVRMWLEHNHQEDELRKFLQLEDVSRDFSRLVGETRSQLLELYRSDASEPVMRQRKAMIFSEFELNYQLLSDSNWQGKRYYSPWFEEPLNNARLALFNTYQGSSCAFEDLWVKSGGDWQKFHQLAEQISRLPGDERRTWLMQSCSAIALRDRL